MSDHFQAHVTRTETGSVIALAGDIDRAAADGLESAYELAVADGARRVVLDFGRVGYINSTGIAVVVGLLARARRDLVPLAACGLTDHYRQIFEITRIADFIEIVPGPGAALERAVPDARR